MSLKFILITAVLAGNLFASAYGSSKSEEKRSSCGRPVLRPCACVTVDPCEVDPSEPRPNSLTAEDVQKNIRRSLPKQLDLSGQGIESLEKNAFENCTDITSLNLSNNKISELPALVFKKLTNLEHLSLADNNISNTKNAFAGLSNLKTLDISGNPMTEILDDGCFFGLTNSCDITIKGISGIKKIGTNAFENKYPTSAEDTVNNGESNAETEPKSIHARSAQSGWGENADLNKNFHSQVCIEGDSVQRLDILETPGNLTSGCKKVSTKWKTYDLSGMGISKFENGWYRLNDENKVPSHLSAINFEGNNIVQVTSNIMNELSEFITWMDLNNNKIERLQEGCFEHKRIFSLSLADNLIGEIEDNAFKMPALYQLYLTGNRLKDTKFVSTLPSSLVSLSLDKNEITEISANSFANREGLRYLSLSGNKLTMLKNQCLLGATSINQLIISHNKITTVESGAFEGLQPFQILLDHNNISSLENGTFTAITGMRQLNVAKNQLTAIEPGMFDQPNLRLLQLGGNNIMSIKRGTVRNLNQLETLEISHNPIERLENGVLFGLNKTAKVYVDVTGTPIKVIQGGLFDDV